MMLLRSSTAHGSPPLSASAGDLSRPPRRVDVRGLGLIGELSPRSGEPQRTRCVGVLGLGLIGRAVVESLQKRGFVPVHSQKLTWGSPPRLSEELRELGEMTLGRSACEIVWCAGRAGFSATTSETDCEFSTFETVVEWAEALAAKSSEMPVGFSMMSSAGGLYEGQQHVDDQSPCRPCRPYGCLKLAQESRLRESSQLTHRRVFRPSSVFGWLRSGQRKGLIPTLIHNGLRNQETSFDGSFNTLRDYIWVGDVAETVVRSLLDQNRDAPTNSTRFIASGQPCSIFQIKQLVEATIGRRLQLKFVSQASNARDTTFSARCVRDNGPPTDLSVAIRRIANDFSSQGVWLDAR